MLLNNPLILKRCRVNYSQAIAAQVLHLFGKLPKELYSEEGSESPVNHEALERAVNAVGDDLLPNYATERFLFLHGIEVLTVCRLDPSDISKDDWHERYLSELRNDFGDQAAEAATPEHSRQMQRSHQKLYQLQPEPVNIREQPAVEHVEALLQKGYIVNVLTRPTFVEDIGPVVTALLVYKQRDGHLYMYLPSDGGIMRYTVNEFAEYSNSAVCLTAYRPIPE